RPRSDAARRSCTHRSFQRYLDATTGAEGACSAAAGEGMVLGTPFAGRGVSLRLVGTFMIVVLGALTSPAGSRAQAPALDCTGDTIYQIQGESTGSTSGRLNTVAVGSMSGENPLIAAQVGSAIPAGVANALGVSESGAAAWALAPQQPAGTGGTLI